MREKIEIILNPDGSLFVNFWDWAHGNDVVGEMKSIDDTGINVEGQICTFSEYLKKVQESVNKRTV